MGMAVASKNVVDDTLPKIGLEDQIQFNSFTAIKTWSLFNPKETELAAAYDKALKQLKEELGGNALVLFFIILR